MEPLLFLGSEFLRKMTDSTLPEEDREAVRAEFAAYLETEEGSAAAPQLIKAFNTLDIEDLRTFPSDTLLWYLDWISSLDSHLLGIVEPATVAKIWHAFNDEVLRARAIEVLVITEPLRETKPSDSQVLNILRLVAPFQEDRVITAEATELGLQVVDSLLTEQSDFALRVLRSSLDHSRGEFRSRWTAHIEDRLTQLGPLRAQNLRDLIFGKE